MSHPYENLPDRAFWSTAVAKVSPLAWVDIYRKRFDISPKDCIASAGSCFAQHIGLQLAARAFNYADFEPAPEMLPREDRRTFGYGLFSARYGNIYTARQLLQLVQRAYGRFAPKEDHWEQDGRFFDPFRPSIEPNGFASREELKASQETHFAAVRRLFEEIDVFVFTFGLTEAWVHKADGAVYPTCPGTIAGTFSSDLYAFHNFSSSEIERDMLTVVKLLRRRNPKIRFLFTVSPVPLTATATDDHVLVATTYSKSVLRTVAGELRQRLEFVDYFPSYEIVTAPASRGIFLEGNLREVTDIGVQNVMAYFFAQHAPRQGRAHTTAGRPARSVVDKHDQDGNLLAPHRRKDDVEIICDEEKLDLVRG